MTGFFNDAKTGVPEIVEDEDTMYVIVRLDITERMDEDDLWSESNVDSVRYKMFSDDLQDMLDSWGEEYEVVKMIRPINVMIRSRSRLNSLKKQMLN